MWQRKRGRSLLRVYELAVVDAVASSLAPQAHSLFAQQLEALRSVQRLDGDREVNLYPELHGGRPRHNPAIAFRNRAPELKLATVRLVAPSGVGRATVFAVRGHVFQLAIRPMPKELGDRDRIVARDVTLHADPMLPDEGAAADQLVDALDPVLRSELDALWAAGTAAELGLLGRAELYSIELDDGGYVCLAQLPDTTILVAGTDPPRPGVRRYDPDGDLHREHASIADALAASVVGNSPA